MLTGGSSSEFELNFFARLSRDLEGFPFGDFPVKSRPTTPFAILRRTAYTSSDDESYRHYTILNSLSRKFVPYDTQITNVQGNHLSRNHYSTWKLYYALDKDNKPGCDKAPVRFPVSLLERSPIKYELVVDVAKRASSIEGRDSIGQAD